MRILHLIMSANPTDGGPIEGVRQFGAALRETGKHEVEVATVDDPHAPFLADFPLPIHALGPSYSWYGFTPRFVPWLRVHAASYDVVVVNGLWRSTSFAAWRVLRNTSTPYVVFTHGMLDPYFKKRYPLKHLKKWLYWPWAEYRVLRDAAAVLFTCEQERLRAQKSFGLYSAREIVIGYGTSSTSAQAEHERGFFSTHYPNLVGKRLALFIGRLHPVKGCDLVLEAFASVLAPDRNWHLVMAGPDPVGLRTPLEDLSVKLGVSDRITWTGMIDGVAKRSLLAAAEIFLLPSHSENFGIVVAEALSFGLPPLISDKVNIWQELEQDGAALVAADDFEGACSLLQTWLSMSDKEKLVMRQRAKDCFEKRFDIHNVTTRLLSVLNEIVLSRRDRSLRLPAACHPVNAQQTGNPNA